MSTLTGPAERHQAPDSAAAARRPFARRTLGVTITPNMAARRYWNLGARLGRTMRVIRIHIR